MYFVCQVRANGLMRVSQQVVAAAGTNKRQGGKICGVIEGSSRSLKAIVKRILINFRDKHAIFTNFHDKNAVVFAKK